MIPINTRMINPQELYADLQECQKEIKDLIGKHKPIPLVDDFSLPEGRSMILYHRGHPVGFLKTEDKKLQEAVSRYIKKAEVFIDLPIWGADSSLRNKYLELQDSVAFTLHRRANYSVCYRGSPEAQDLRVRNAFSYIYNKEGA